MQNLDSMKNQVIQSYKINLLEEKLVLTGRCFLKNLVSAEQKLKDSQISTLPKDNLILMQIQNWQCVVALMIRKLSAYFLSETDYDNEITHPIFIIKGKEEAANDIDTI